MIIISYDIKNNKVRTKFSRMLSRYGAIRLQYSVYEVNNTKRIIDIITHQIEEGFGRQFTPEDSVVIFEVLSRNVLKFGNAIHRDQAVVYI